MKKLKYTATTLCIIFIVIIFTTMVPISCNKQKSGDLGNTQNIYIFKYANTQSENHPRSQSMVYFKDQLEKATDGRIKVELYLSGILGTEAEELDLVKNGIIQGFRGGLFEKANKKYIIYTLPFLFEKTDQVLKVIHSDFGKKINQEALNNGFYIPACGIAGGFRNITNNIRPIEKPRDLINLKLRTPPLDITIKTFEILGAIPQQIAYTETYRALNGGIVDGQENPFSNIADMKFYEVQKYLSIINWQVHPDPFYVNPNWYQNLPDELKIIFNSIANATIEYSNEKWLESEKKFYNFLSESMEVNSITPEEFIKFKEAVKPVWQYYVDHNYFTWEDIETVIEISAVK